ncbi:hypothetical protein F511_18686 [Dorcoceras hygrometricum]|uniref:Uncharacterized protein n=1 Tax=Dorcoceras hygrometricum TaxID=472368 RepID=A0A2Z7APQ5_9LAMI|nr:hypothetical protein F511_18686 [Dorcoceras hygrometricum]
MPPRCDRTHQDDSMPPPPPPPSQLTPYERARVDMLVGIIEFSSVSRSDPGSRMSRTWLRGDGALQLISAAADDIVIVLISQMSSYVPAAVSTC